MRGKNWLTRELVQNGWTELKKLVEQNFIFFNILNIF